jgi:hypothetical protein
LIHRESDGERIWYGHARPFGGKKTEAYTIFKVIASECVSLDGLTSVKDASAEQLITLQKLNNIFIPGGGGEWDLMEIN